ncbi:hypothetical protein Bca101_006891 [Brassica carinata]
MRMLTMRLAHKLWRMTQALMVDLLLPSTSSLQSLRSLPTTILKYVLKRNFISLQKAHLIVKPVNLAKRLVGDVVQTA